MFGKLPKSTLLRLIFRGISSGSNWRPCETRVLHELTFTNKFAIICKLKPVEVPKPKELVFLGFLQFLVSSLRLVQGFVPGGQWFDQRHYEAFHVLVCGTDSPRKETQGNSLLIVHTGTPFKQRMVTSFATESSLTKPMRKCTEHRHCSPTFNNNNNNKKQAIKAQAMQNDPPKLVKNKRLLNLQCFARVINPKSDQFLLQPCQNYCIAEYEELAFHSLLG